MEYTNYNTVPSVTSLNDTDTLHITTGGTHRQATVATLIAKAKAQTQTAIEAALLDKLTEGCYIMYHRKADGARLAQSASTWTSLQSSGEIAAGVMVISGTSKLVVAPTEPATALLWSSQNVLVGTAYNEASAQDVLNGKQQTAAILADSTIGGDGSGYAPGYCAAYSRLNANNVGFGAGKWWLPSMGELNIIAANYEKINMCLSLISGATRLAANFYLSSTETAADKYIGMYVNTYSYMTKLKTSEARYVRPVTAYHQNA